MQKITLGEIPTPSTAITREIVLKAAGGSITINFEYDRDGTIYAGGLSFTGIRAYRFRAESHCDAWHIEGAYDSIVEVLDSDWVAELNSTGGTESHSMFEMHHYMIYIDSDGCYEFTGASWSLLAEEVVKPATPNPGQDDEC